MHFINIFRGIVTTIIGVIAICASGYFFFWGEEDWGWQYYAIPFGVGIVLLLMPDDIPAFIRRLADKFIFKKTDEPK